jgi:hypothetical protein
MILAPWINPLLGNGSVVPLPSVARTTTCICRGLIPRRAQTGMFYCLVFGRRSYLKADSSEPRCGMELPFFAALAGLRSDAGLPWNYPHAETGTRHNNKHIWTRGASGICLGAGWNYDSCCDRIRSALSITWSSHSHPAPSKNATIHNCI